MNALIRFALAALAGLPATVVAQGNPWQVVGGERGDVLTPGLPAGIFRTFGDMNVGNRGAGQFGFRVASPPALEGYWASGSGGFVRYTQLGVGGALGPGRSGSEAGHQFLSVASGQGDAAPDGQRAFVARAGDPANPAQATHGLWRWDGAGNIEIARAGTDGVYGPGLGASFRFPDSSIFAQARMASGGIAVANAAVTTPGGETAQAVFRHVPGSGNRACLLTGTTDPALAPGLTGSDSFMPFNAGLDRVGLSAFGRVHARLVSSTLREGIWELCNGSPRARAVTGESGPRGPDVGVPTAIFVDIGLRAPQPTGASGFVFLAQWRMEPVTANLPGLFRFNGNTSRGLAYPEPTGYFGPNWSNATWRSFNADTLSVAGDYAALAASIDVPGAGTQTGLWRVHAGSRPEIVALIGATAPPLAPAADRTWRDFEALAVLGNGDIVLEASTNPDNLRELWLLQPGQAPRRLLSPGQPLSVPTAQGPTATGLLSFDIVGGGARFSDGTDAWIGADGTLYLEVNSTSFGRLHIAQALPLPGADGIFANGFE